MRKYRQVFIFVITVLSICGFFFYRSAYTKLKATIETLVLFSSPVERQDCLILNETLLEKSKSINQYSQPNHVWIQIGEYYVYSAFWKKDGDKSYSKAIGVGTTEIIISEHECHVWYKLKDRIFSVTGNFWFISKRIKKLTLYRYELYCGVNTSEIKGYPYMFVFLDKNSTKKYFIPIYNRPKKTVRRNAAICVFPDILGSEMVSITEFLSFHQVIGITDFIIYDIGIHYGFLNTLQSVYNVMNSVPSFSILTWHFPYDNTEALEDLVKIDCIHRTLENEKFLIFLKWNEYLIPREKKTVIETFTKFDNTSNLEVNIKFRKCCLEENDDRHSENSWPVVLKKTNCFNEDNFGTALISHSDVHFHNMLNLSSSVATINSFSTCDDIKKSETFYDSGALVFLVELMKSNLLRIWRSGTLFDN